MTDGEWNERQTFVRGSMFLIASLAAGGFMVGRIDEAEPAKMIVAAVNLATVDEAVAAAQRLKKESLH